MAAEWEQKPVVWRHSIWQAQAPTAPQRWPRIASVLLLGGLCAAAWTLLAGAVHVLVVAAG